MLADGKKTGDCLTDTFSVSNPGGNSPPGILMMLMMVMVVVVVVAMMVMVMTMVMMMMMMATA